MNDIELTLVSLAPLWKSFPILITLIGWYTSSLDKFGISVVKAQEYSGQIESAVMKRLTLLLFNFLSLVAEQKKLETNAPTQTNEPESILSATVRSIDKDDYLDYIAKKMDLESYSKDGKDLLEKCKRIHNTILLLTLIAFFLVLSVFVFPSQGALLFILWGIQIVSFCFNFHQIRQTRDGYLKILNKPEIKASEIKL